MAGMEQLWENGSEVALDRLFLCVSVLGGRIYSSRF